MASVLGLRLRELRRKTGLTQRALCQAVGLKPSALSQYESGTRMPDDAIKQRLADFFGVSLDYLAGRDDFALTALERGDPFPVTVVDESLANLGIHPFSRLQIDREATVENGMLGLIELSDGRTVVRRVERKERFILLIAENGAYETMVVRSSQIRILGRVTGVMTSLEKGR